MKFNKLSWAVATLTTSMIGFGCSGSFAGTTSFFGEDLQHFKSGEIQDAPDLSILKNSYAAEQKFLDAVASGYATVNFEPEEGFTTLGKTGSEFLYNQSLRKTDGGIVDMIISDPNNGDIALHTSIEDTAGDVTGGRYGISEVNKTMEERLRNQFLNTNAGKDSNLKISFFEAISAFGFYGIDFERGGVMGLELTRVDGTIEYISLGLSNPEDFDKTIRGTAFYFGHIAESENEYFTEVHFDVRDTAKGTHDIVSFDRMTFASPTLKQEVAEPSFGILALGTFLSGAAFKRRKNK